MVKKAFSIGLIIFFLTSIDYVYGQSIQFDDPFLNSNINKIHVVANMAEIVFVGTIIDIGKPPGYESGYFLSGQSVTYSIGEVLKGNLSNNQIKVFHKISKGSRNTDPEGGKLNYAIFTIDSEFIVFAKKMGYDFWDLDANVGTIKGTAQNITAVEDILVQIQK